MFGSGTSVTRTGLLRPCPVSTRSSVHSAKSVVVSSTNSSPTPARISKDNFPSSTNVGGSITGGSTGTLRLFNTTLTASTGRMSNPLPVTSTGDTTNSHSDCISKAAVGVNVITAATPVDVGHALARTAAKLTLPEPVFHNGNASPGINAPVTRPVSARLSGWFTVKLNPEIAPPVLSNRTTTLNGCPTVP